MDRRTYLATLGGATVAGLAGCTVFGEQEYDVGMTANAFKPDEYEVFVGETVVWRNTSSRSHTVTAYENAIPEDAEYFASGGYESEQAARDSWESGLGGNIEVQETYSHTFETPGEYHYVCIPHERRNMTGVIVVTDEE